MFYIPQLFSSFAHLEEIGTQNLNINIYNMSTLLTLTYHLDRIKKNNIKVKFPTREALRDQTTTFRK